MTSTQSSSNISALHRQKVKGREIVVTEDPRLHLVWIYDRVFVKPLPRYLLSHLFWSQFLSTEQSVSRGRTQKEQQIYARIRTSALGLLRTYYYLIQHESDFQIACKDDVQLLPSDISWEEFCRFSQKFLGISDAAVSERYYYGELRLTRLNFYAKFLLRKFQYERIRGQYGVHFARFYGPLLFVFGIFSLILSAMQVELAVETLLTSSQWQKFLHACRWFVIVTLLCMAVIALVLPSLLIGMHIDELIFALKDRYGKKSSPRRQNGNS